MIEIYHEGELAVQARAGVQETASRLGRSIRSFMPLAAQEFLGSLPIEGDPLRDNLSVNNQDG